MAKKKARGGRAKVEAKIEDKIEDEIEDNDNFEDEDNDDIDMSDVKESLKDDVEGLKFWKILQFFSILVTSSLFLPSFM